MKNFNTARFRDFGKWDLTTNRSIYIKWALAIFAIMALDTFSSCVLTYDNLAFMGSDAIQIMTAKLCSEMSGKYLILSVFIMGFLLHNLRDKQSRIMELTLPATNLEKFLWHATLCIVAPLLVWVLSFLVLDLIRYVYLGSLLGFDQAYSMTGMLFTTLWGNGMPGIMQEGIKAGSTILSTDIEEAFSFGTSGLLSINFMLYIAFLSTFALGSAYKYRHNIIYTFLAHMALWIALFTLVVIISMDFDRTGNFCLFLYEHPSVIQTSLYIIIAFITVLCWWGAYRLYCRATITSKRNP